MSARMRGAAMVFALWGCAMAGDCLPPSGSRITARDLAAAVPAFAKAAPEAFVAFSPLAGSRRVLAPIELQRAAAALGVELTEPATEVCFEWPMETATEAMIVEALRRSAGADATIRVLEWPRGPVPRGRLEFPAAGFGGGPSAPGVPAIWRGSIDYGGERPFAIWARVIVTAPGTRVVAAERLRAGRAIERGQLRAEKVDAAPFAGVPSMPLEAMVGKTPRLDIAAGAVVDAQQLSAPNEVEKGDMVTLEMRTARTHLSTSAIAEAAGHRGDWIPVRNASSGKRLRARVEARGVVSIEAGGASRERIQ